MKNFNNYLKLIKDNMKLILIMIGVIILTAVITVYITHDDDKSKKAHNNKIVAQKKDKIAKDDKKPIDDNIKPEQREEEKDDEKGPGRHDGKHAPKKPDEKLNDVKLSDSQKKELSDLYTEVNGINDKIIDKYVSYGCITKEQADVIKERLKKESDNKKDEQEKILFFKKWEIPSRELMKK